MKKRKIGIFFILIFGIVKLGMAQFEGKLEYSISYQTTDKEISSFTHSLPKKSNFLIKNEHLRINQALAGGGEQAFIANANLNSSILMMNFLGQEFQVKMNADDLTQLKQTKKMKIIQGSDTKTIAGHLCKQAFALDRTDTLEIFYAPDIQTPTILPQFEDIAGLPLKYEVVKNKLHIIYTCISVSEEPIPGSTFEVPEKVKEIPFNEFARAFAIPK